MSAQHVQGQHVSHHAAPAPEGWPRNGQSVRHRTAGLRPPPGAPARRPRRPAARSTRTAPRRRARAGCSPARKRAWRCAPASAPPSPPTAPPTCARPATRAPAHAGTLVAVSGCYTVAGQSCPNRKHAAPSNVRAGSAAHISKPLQERVQARHERSDLLADTPLGPSRVQCCYQGQVWLNAPVGDGLKAEAAGSRSVPADTVV